MEELSDPFRPVEELLARVPQEEILKLYHIAEFSNTDHMLG